MWNAAVLYFLSNLLVCLSYLQKCDFCESSKPAIWNKTPDEKCIQSTLKDGTNHERNKYSWLQCIQKLHLRYPTALWILFSVYFQITSDISRVNCRWSWATRSTQQDPAPTPVYNLSLIMLFCEYDDGV